MGGGGGGEEESKQAGCTGLCLWIILRTKVDGLPFGEKDKDSMITC